MASLVGCGRNDGGYPNGNYDPCRYDPGNCGGDLGALCRTNLDCAAGSMCCRAPKECGGGMCTLSCRTAVDCPVDMTCDHGVCFFVCGSNLDCAPGQHCAPAPNACEW